MGRRANEQCPESASIKPRTRVCSYAGVPKWSWGVHAKFVYHLCRSSVLLSDFAKAFERVISHWIMHVLLMCCSLEERLFGSYLIAVMSSSDVVSSIRSTMELIWVGPSVSFSSVSLWIPGITMFARFPMF